MAAPAHTYGPTCKLSPSVAFTGTRGNNEAPPMQSHFFYASPLPIDDPLSAVPTSVDSEAKFAKHPPRPFSAYDNFALEKAWSLLASEQDYKHHRRLGSNSLKPLSGAQSKRRASFVDELATKHNRKHALSCKKKSGKEPANASEIQGESKSGSTQPGSGDSAEASSSAFACTCDECDECQPGSCAAAAESTTLQHEEGVSTLCQLDEVTPACCAELEREVKSAQMTFSGGINRKESKAHQEMLVRDIMIEVKNRRNPFATSSKKLPAKPESPHSHGDAANDNEQLQELKTAERAEVIRPAEPDKKLKGSRLAELSRKELKDSRDNHEAGNHREFDQASELSSSPGTITKSKNANLSPSNNVPPGNMEAGTTRMPFQRAPTRPNYPRPNSPAPAISFSGVDAEASHTGDAQSESIHVHRCKASRARKADPEVAVGVSRLHLVKLPALQMTPIYWSPVHDVAAVTRGTWFYKETMYAVEPAVANQLELGYRELRPWSQTWADELNSAVEVGAAGEEKVSHKLWPDSHLLKTDRKKLIDSEHDKGRMDFAADPYCAARCFHGEIAATGTLEPPRSESKGPLTAEILKRYPNSHVIYKDAQNAFILKPSLQPSENMGRKPLSKIKRGITVGIPVVRGFDWKTWEKLHPSNKSATTKQAEWNAPVAKSTTTLQRSDCPACRNEQDRPKVSDLVLVVHGIGQKLSERMESFHFTHAVNAFRRAVNMELNNEKVQPVLRKDLGGIMVLPVNWRSNLSFEEGGPRKESDKDVGNAAEDFSLKDITPDTIPAVRNLISDVLLDIPYYLSQHKPRMIEALIMEANRVFRLWCKNNPEFQENGRVHIIAHSLGSAMALDVLSKQPTSVRHVKIDRKKIQTKHFEFNTTNLFFAGSPAGFFLLLDRGRLIPRRDTGKPDADVVDGGGKDITGQAGTLGCLAVHNLYNIMHYNDPIAYRLNATVDPTYAASLKPAQVPTSTTGWFESISRMLTPGASAIPDVPVGQLASKPQVARLPSQLEMEVHDFTREEIAEKKFYLMNDNGQVDYFLATGGGPLEIQYINMLGAHSSYWTSPDFIRMLVTEVGRKPGKTNTLPNMKAIKAAHKKKGERS